MSPTSANQSLSLGISTRGSGKVVVGARDYLRKL